MRRQGDCKNVGGPGHGPSPGWPRAAAQQVVHVTIPNFITIARLIAVPLIVWLMIADRYVEATVLFVLAGLSDAADGFILDGFPRTEGQVEALDRLIGTDGLDAVVVFEVDEDELVERMLARGRPDDTEDTIRNRFHVYQEQTEPLLDIFGVRGLLVRVDGVGDVDEVTERILTALEQL